jgi:hypothetical protein
MGFKILASPQRVERTKAMGYALTREQLGYARVEDFFDYMCVEGNKWPVRGVAEAVVPLTDGRETLMWVEPQGAVPMQARYPNRRVKTSKHRCFVRCPDCKATVPAGRTTQHKCKGN